MWILTGFLSAAATGLTLFLAWKNNEKKSWSAFAAVSFAAFTILLEYGLAETWVEMCIRDSPDAAKQQGAV